TDRMCLNADKSYFSITLSLPPISILNAVGALYHIVTFSSSSAPYHDSGENLPPTITFVARFSHGAKIPYEVPVTQPGSAVHQYTSSSFKSRTYLPEIYCCTIAYCACSTPLGWPVEPLV